MSKEHSASSGSERARARASSIVSPTMNAWPRVCIDCLSAARTIGATMGLVRLAAEYSPASSDETSGSRRPAALSSVKPVRSSRSVSPRTPASRMAARRSAISWSARRASGVRSSASARLISALPCALSSGNCSSIRSTSGRERWSARARSTQRAARVRASVSAPCMELRSAMSSLEAPASGRSVASLSRARIAASSAPSPPPPTRAPVADIAISTGRWARRQHLGDRAREVVEILAPQPRDVHAAVVDHVNVMLRAQLPDLRCRDAEKREHPVVTRNEAEVAPRAALGEVSHDLTPQLLDTVAHGIELVGPLPAEHGVGEDRLDDGGAVIGGHRPERAREAYQLAHGGIGVRLRLAHHAQGARALAVQTEVLRARHREQQLRELGAEEPQAEGVRVQALAEALVGHVDEGDELTALDQREDLAPFALSQVGARRVVTRGVQQHHGPRRQPLERGEHLLELHSAARRIVIGIGLEPDPAA